MYLEYGICKKLGKKKIVVLMLNTKLYKVFQTFNEWIPNCYGDQMIVFLTNQNMLETEVSIIA